MGTSFVSYSSKDKYFVDLFIQLLNHHHIQTWYDSHQIKPGSKYLEEIENGLKSADHFIAIISRNSIKSNWITREITSFITSSPNAKVIPVVIEEVDLNEVFDGLGEFQAILFYENMLEGFKKLANIFGREFLPSQDRRLKKERRSDERREFYDRRRSPIIQRLRKGFWKCYADKTGVGPFDDFHLLPSNRIKLTDVLQEEIKRYDYFDCDGNSVEMTPSELDKITFGVWEDLSAREYVSAINVVESVAEKVYQNYSNVKPTTRREEKRRVGSDRRSGVDSCENL